MKRTTRAVQSHTQVSSYRFQMLSPQIKEEANREEKCVNFVSETHKFYAFYVQLSKSITIRELIWRDFFCFCWALIVSFLTCISPISLSSLLIRRIHGFIRKLQNSKSLPRWFYILFMQKSNKKVQILKSIRRLNDERLNGKKRQAPRSSKILGTFNERKSRSKSDKNSLENSVQRQRRWQRPEPLDGVSMESLMFQPNKNEVEQGEQARERRKNERRRHSNEKAKTWESIREW